MFLDVLLFFQYLKLLANTARYHYFNILQHGILIKFCSNIFYFVFSYLYCKKNSIFNYKNLFIDDFNKLEN